jgi:hypothetical protein
MPRVKTRITAPNGSYNEYDTGELADSYAVANVSFPHNFIPGEYFVESDHWQWCPTAFALEYAGSTLVSEIAVSGYSITWWKRSTPDSQPGDCAYNKIASCTAACQPSDPYTRACGSRHVRAFRSWYSIGGRKICAFPNEDQESTEPWDSCGDFSN